MYSHYIRLDNKNRIIYGFSDYYDSSIDTDVLIRQNAGKEFELFGKDYNRPLFFIPANSNVEIYLYKYDNCNILRRTKAELDDDLAFVSREVPLGESLLEIIAEHEYRLCLIELGVN